MSNNLKEGMYLHSLFWFPAVLLYGRFNMKKYCHNGRVHKKWINEKARLLFRIPLPVKDCEGSGL